MGLEDAILQLAQAGETAGEIAVKLSAVATLAESLDEEIASIYSGVDLPEALRGSTESLIRYTSLAGITATTIRLYLRRRAGLAD